MVYRLTMRYIGKCVFKVPYMLQNSSRVLNDVTSKNTSIMFTFFFFIYTFIPNHHQFLLNGYWNYSAYNYYFLNLKQIISSTLQEIIDRFSLNLEWNLVTMPCILVHLPTSPAPSSVHMELLSFSSLTMLLFKPTKLISASPLLYFPLERRCFLKNILVVSHLFGSCPNLLLKHFAAHQLLSITFFNFVFLILYVLYVSVYVFSLRPFSEVHESWRFNSSFYSMT